MHSIVYVRCPFALSSLNFSLPRHVRSLSFRQFGACFYTYGLAKSTVCECDQQLTVETCQKNLMAAYTVIEPFVCLFMAICKAQYVDNVESQVLEAVARWSVIGKVVSF